MFVNAHHLYGFDTVGVGMGYILEISSLFPLNYSPVTYH
jgi:hypothetical protein